MTNTETYTKGQEVWILMGWIDDECWVEGEVVKVNAKTVTCINLALDDIEAPRNYKFKNVKLPQS